MGRKKNKNKKKRINPKKERYSKFRKEKPTNLTFTPPEVTLEQQKERVEDEQRVAQFLRYCKNPPAREVVERRMKSKR